MGAHNIIQLQMDARNLMCAQNSRWWSMRSQSVNQESHMGSKILYKTFWNGGQESPAQYVSICAWKNGGQRSFYNMAARETLQEIIKLRTRISFTQLLSTAHSIRVFTECHGSNMAAYDCKKFLWRPWIFYSTWHPMILGISKYWPGF
jgi:hypothetical protein